jgi:hypothetical protein
MDMTHKERMLKAARGQQPDRLPWAPRIDLWHNSNSMRGTLPSRFKREATLDEVADFIGGAYHKIVPEFLKARTPEDNIDRGLGVYRLYGMAYRPELVGVDREVKKEGDTTTVTYHTPVGSVSCKILYTGDMKRAGASITWMSEPVIKDPEDYRVVGYIFKNIEIHPDYDNYRDYQARVGDKGYAAAYANLASSPMHHIMKEFLEPTKFYLELYDHPKELQQLAEDLESYYDQIYRVLADSPAEVIFSGGNYLSSLLQKPYSSPPPEICLHPPSEGETSSDPLRRGEQGAPGPSGGERNGRGRGHLPPAHDQGDAHRSEESVQGQDHPLRRNPFGRPPGAEHVGSGFRRLHEETLPGNRPGRPVHPGRQRHDAPGRQVREAASDYGDGGTVGEPADESVDGGTEGKDLRWLESETWKPGEKTFTASGPPSSSPGSG